MGTGHTPFLELGRNFISILLSDLREKGSSSEKETLNEAMERLLGISVAKGVTLTDTDRDSAVAKFFFVLKHDPASTEELNALTQTLTLALKNLKKGPTSREIRRYALYSKLISGERINSELDINKQTKQADTQKKGDGSGELDKRIEKIHQLLEKNTAVLGTINYSSFNNPLNPVILGLFNKAHSTLSTQVSKDLLMSHSIKTLKGLLSLQENYKTDGDGKLGVSLASLIKKMLDLISSRQFSCVDCEYYSKGTGKVCKKGVEEKNTSEQLNDQYYCKYWSSFPQTK